MKGKETGGGEEVKLNSGEVGYFCGEGKGKFGDGEEVEFGGGEEGLKDQQIRHHLRGGSGSITRNPN